jgi:hypothetical protein
MGTEKEHWLVSFSDERLRNTLRGFLAAAQRAGLSPEAIGHLSARMADNGEHPYSSEKASLWGSLTELILSESSTEYLPTLNSELTRKISDAWSASNLDDIDFSAKCSSSSTQWDEYIRSVTPDIPTMLGDYVAVEVLGKDRFAYFWHSLLKNLSSIEKSQLNNWYTHAARELVGEEFTLPSE